MPFILTAAAGVQVVRDFRAPEGLSAAEVDANGDGELLAVLDLRPDTELAVRPQPQILVSSARCWAC